LFQLFYIAGHPPAKSHIMSDQGESSAYSKALHAKSLSKSISQRTRKLTKQIEDKRKVSEALRTQVPEYEALRKEDKLLDSSINRYVGRAETALQDSPEAVRNAAADTMNRNRRSSAYNENPAPLRRGSDASSLNESMSSEARSRVPSSSLRDISRPNARSHSPTSSEEAPLRNRRANQASAPAAAAAAAPSSSAEESLLSTESDTEELLSTEADTSDERDEPSGSVSSDSDFSFRNPKDLKAWKRGSGRPKKL